MTKEKTINEGVVMALVIVTRFVSTLAELAFTRMSKRVYHGKLLLVYYSLTPESSIRPGSGSDADGKSLSSGNERYQCLISSK